jgi:soluble lytic murein transglycosylase-like protein
VAVACCNVSAQTAKADVLEIGDNGSVTVHSVPELIGASGTQPSPVIAGTPAQNFPTRGHSRSAPHTAEIRSMLATAAARYSISPLLLSAVAWRESAFDPAAKSPKGARGIMQLMPATAHKLCTAECSASENAEAGAAYLRQLLERYNGDVVKALAAYNAGSGAIDRFRGIPPYRETRLYVDAILARLASEAMAGPN